MPLPALLAVGRGLLGTARMGLSAAKMAFKASRKGGGAGGTTRHAWIPQIDPHALQAFHVEMDVNADVYVSASEFNRAMNRAEKKVLRSIGAHVRTAARGSLRHRKPVSIKYEIVPIFNEWHMSRQVMGGLKLSQLNQLEKWTQSRLKKIVRRIKSGTSKPGDTPRVHYKNTLKFILFEHQPKRHRVIIGPAGIPSLSYRKVPRILESGGVQKAKFIDVNSMKTWNRHRKIKSFWPKRLLHIEKRPFMITALQSVTPHIGTMSSKTPWINKADVRPRKRKPPGA